MVVNIVIDAEVYLDSFECSHHEEHNNRYDGAENDSAFNENPELECLVLSRQVFK